MKTRNLTGGVLAVAAMAALACSPAFAQDRGSFPPPAPRDNAGERDRGQQNRNDDFQDTRQRNEFQNDRQRDRDRNQYRNDRRSFDQNDRQFDQQRQFDRRGGHRRSGDVIRGGTTYYRNGHRGTYRHSGRTYISNGCRSGYHHGYRSNRSRAGNRGYSRGQRHYAARPAFDDMLASRRPGLGVTFDDRQQGLVVRRVYPGSPAERAGLQEGDRIIEMNGQRIRGDMWANVQTIRRMNPGDELNFTVDRDGERQQLDARLGTWEDAFAQRDRTREQNDGEQNDARRGRDAPLVPEAPAENRDANRPERNQNERPDRTDPADRDQAAPAESEPLNRNPAEKPAAEPKPAAPAEAAPKAADRSETPAAESPEQPGSPQPSAQPALPDAEPAQPESPDTPATPEQP